MNVGKYAKAIAAGTFSGLSLLSGILAANSVHHSPVTFSQWVTIGLSALGGTGFVYAVPNSPAEPPIDQGHSWTETVPPDVPPATLPDEPEGSVAQ